MEETFHWNFVAIIKTFFFSLIILVSFLGNLFVLIAPCLHKKILQSTTNYFIINLAIADLLVSISVLPFAAVYNLYDVIWYFGPAYHQIWRILDIWCCTASIFSLVVISFDRYIGVTKPLKYQVIVTKKRALMLNMSVWIAAFLISGPPQIIFGSQLNEQNQSSPNATYETISSVVIFFIPMSVCLIFYWRIYRIVRNVEFNLANGVVTSDTGKNINLRIHNGRYNVAGQGQEGVEKSLPAERTKNSSIISINTKFQKQKNVSKSLGIVVGILLLCWAPFFTSLLLIHFGLNSNSYKIFIRIFIWLGYLNSALNPFIYVASSRQFKIAFKKMICCNCSLSRNK